MCKCKLEFALAMKAPGKRFYCLERMGNSGKEEEPGPDLQVR